jgi:hypothetical protein
MKGGSILGALAVKRQEENERTATLELEEAMGAAGGQLGEYYAQNAADPSTWAAETERVTAGVYQRFEKDKRFTREGREQAGVRRR